MASTELLFWKSAFGTLTEPNFRHRFSSFPVICLMIVRDAYLDFQSYKDAPLPIDLKKVQNSNKSNSP